jgi:hypothetical protein
MAEPAPGQDAIPNRFSYAPSGWDYPIVPSNVKGTHTFGPDLSDGDSTYFDFAVAGNGSSTAKPRFYTYLYGDGYVFAGFCTESLPSMYYTYFDDYGFMVSSGSHTISGFTDSLNVVAESLENDNRWSRSFTWRQTGNARANLTPNAPPGWDFPIVPSNVRGTHTVGPDLADLATTFVDWCIANLGNYVAKPLLYVYVYFDGTAFAGWSLDSLAARTYTTVEDDEQFFTSGTHVLGLVGDSTRTTTDTATASTGARGWGPRRRGACRSGCC